MAGIFRYHKAARQDFMEAVAWYEEKSPGKGLDFANAFVNTLHKIAANPDIYRKVFKDFRKISMPDFPYYIIYKIRKKTIYILAIYHNKRQKYWEQRV